MGERRTENGRPPTSFHVRKWHWTTRKNTPLSYTLKKMVPNSCCVFMFFLPSLHRLFRTNGKQVDGNSSLRLLFVKHEPKAGDQASHTHTSSLVIINDFMMYRDLMDEQSLQNKRLWLYKTSHAARRKKKDMLMLLFIFRLFTLR